VVVPEARVGSCMSGWYAASAGQSATTHGIRSGVALMIGPDFTGDLDLRLLHALGVRLEPERIGATRVVQPLAEDAVFLHGDAPSPRGRKTRGNMRRIPVANSARRGRFRIETSCRAACGGSAAGTGRDW